MSKAQVFWKVLRGRLIFSACLLVGCFVFVTWILPLIHPPSAEMIIHEVGEHQYIRLRKNFDAGDVYHLRMRVSGQINGTAVLRVFESENPDRVYRETRIGPGKVDGLLLEQDWYHDDCRLEYAPVTATQGGLKLEYLFKASKPRKVN